MVTLVESGGRTRGPASPRRSLSGGLARIDRFPLFPSASLTGFQRSLGAFGEWRCPPRERLRRFSREGRADVERPISRFLGRDIVSRRICDQTHRHSARGVYLVFSRTHTDTHTHPGSVCMRLGIG